MSPVTRRVKPKLSCKRGNSAQLELIVWLSASTVESMRSDWKGSGAGSVYGIEKVLIDFVHNDFRQNEKGNHIRDNLFEWLLALADSKLVR